MKPGESADNEPVTKRKFLRPGESAADTTAPAKSDQPSDRPSWRKAGRTKELKRMPSKHNFAHRRVLSDLLGKILQLLAYVKYRFEML